MKLEKREITLNEADSLKDVFYIERTLFREYSEGKGRSDRKDVNNELATLVEEAKEDMEKVYALWEKSKAGEYC
jgi:hypothetical protein